MSINNIRKVALLDARFVVTPSEKYQGKEMIISALDRKEKYGKELEKTGLHIYKHNDVDVIIFFVSKNEFSHFDDELDEIFTTDENLTVGDKTLIESLEKKYDIAKFIKDRVIKSNYLSKEELASIVGFPFLGHLKIRQIIII
ncbi:hypothetical protein [uncultured Dokdonia sp.]|uniref:hypothetical protein n=1 Tax=uncultured Dokdonia sp. TaxID=575653 RepID=UPI0026248277|nr:hypothetical protein [uncultured Dokdonia sp.]